MFFPGHAGLMFLPGNAGGVLHSNVGSARSVLGLAASAILFPKHPAGAGTGQGCAPAALAVVVALHNPQLT